MAVRNTPDFVSKNHIANMSPPIQVGDDALAGREETNVTHRFPPVISDRKISFKGCYLSIYHQETSDYKTHIDNESPTTHIWGPLGLFLTRAVWTCISVLCTRQSPRRGRHPISHATSTIDGRIWGRYSRAYMVCDVSHEAGGYWEVAASEVGTNAKVDRTRSSTTPWLCLRPN